MAGGRVVDGNARDWHSDRGRGPRHRVCVTGVALPILYLTLLPSWTSASDARRAPVRALAWEVFSDPLPSSWSGEFKDHQSDGDASRHDHSAMAVQPAPYGCRLIVPQSLVATVTAGWKYSATFRAQCRRLVAAHAVVMLDAFTSPGSRAARSRIRVYTDRSVEARIEVPLNAKTLELLAHELEHVLEQVDGVHLAMQEALSRSLTSRSGMAVRLPGGAYETRRAIQAGLQVAAEFRAGTAHRR